MKKCILLFGLLLLLIACQNEEQVIVKKKNVAPTTKENPELVEQSSKDEVDEMVEFILPEEKVMINLEMVPILNAYLSAAKDRAKAVESMHLRPVPYDNGHLYLLKFSCVNESCSYLLLNKNEGNQAYLVADLAQSSKITLSPDSTKILLQFNRVDSTLSNLVVINILEWELLPLRNATNEMELLDYRWPILTSEWIDNQTVSISIPALDEPSSNLLAEWNESGGATQEITLTTN
ncbi:hypothetical protein [Virgibacillus necropolis]|uniref:Lipoprotein n=1 Tax=Virgibacillus necropolis TaxID=163877 RepID=A0A221ME72_9BACI|nr:hypothetical protein [Virgibacillus necropolis]ASN05937.1 hypothetical protein CFK40_13390 [Virgibacillus necropolis]